MSRPADWFHNAVIDGVQRLYALNLPDRPASEVLQLTAITWVEVLWSTTHWDELHDARRLPVAFTRLAAAADRWPAPAALRQHLPPRRQSVPLLAEPVQRPTQAWRERYPQLRAELVGIDRSLKHQPSSGNISAAEKADADSAGTGTE